MASKAPKGIEMDRENIEAMKLMPSRTTMRIGNNNLFIMCFPIHKGLHDSLVKEFVFEKRREIETPIVKKLINIYLFA